MPFLKDLQVSFRALRSNPGFTAVALLSLGLGIGANTAIFSVMDALLLRSLPVANPEELVFLGDGRAAGIAGGFPDGPTRLFSLDFFRSLNASQKVFSGTAAISSLRADVHGRVGNGVAEPLQVRLVSGGYFRMLGVQPVAGRLLAEQDDIAQGGHPLAILNYDFWQRRFAGDPQAVGKSVVINGTIYTIAGIASKGFSGTVVGESPDLWVPLAMQPQLQAWINSPNEQLTQFTWIVARRLPGVSVDEAQAQTNVIYRQWLEKVAGSSPTQDQKESMRKSVVKLTDAAKGASQLRRQYAEPLQILMAMVGIVLLIASANVANLLLARISVRQREISVRVALGATRARLMAQLLTESVLIAILGGIIGLILAWWGAPVLVDLVSSEPRAMALDVSPKPVVLLFTFGLCLVTGVLFGLGPAIRMTRTDTIPGLRDAAGKGAVQGSTRGIAGRLLVIAQVTLAMVLTAGAGWFIQTLHKLRETDTGFETERVLLVQLDPEASGLKEKQLLALGQRIEEKIATVPGVRSASYTMVRYDGGRWVSGMWPEGVEHTRRTAQTSDGNRVGLHYFETLGMQVRQGRNFSEADGPKSEQVVILNETLARKLYPQGDPVGRLAYLGDEARRIIGIVSNTKVASMREEPTGMFFLYNRQTEDGYNDLLVRAAGNPNELLPRLRAAILAEEPNLAIAEITSLGEIVDRSLTQEKMLSKLASLFGALALVLSAVGIYGVLAYAVARRTNEIGVRMALGASPGDVLGMVLKESLLIVGIGALLGIPATLATGRLVASRLYGLTPNDPLTLSIAAAVLLGTAVAASLIPSGRAARLDPLVALRDS
jgi:predicted permease